MYVYMVVCLLSHLRRMYPLAKIIDNDEIGQTSVFPKKKYQFWGNKNWTYKKSINFYLSHVSLIVLRKLL